MRVEILIFGFLWVKLNNAFLIFPENLFYNAHLRPGWSSRFSVLENVNRDMFPAFPFRWKGFWNSNSIADNAICYNLVPKSLQGKTEGSVHSICVSAGIISSFDSSESKLIWRRQSHRANIADFDSLGYPYFYLTRTGDRQLRSIVLKSGMIFSEAESGTWDWQSLWQQTGTLPRQSSPGFGDSFFSRPTVLSLVGNTTRTNGGFKGSRYLW